MDDYFFGDLESRAVSKKLVSHFVIPAKAGIRVFDPGFRIKSGMT